MSCFAPITAYVGKGTSAKGKRLLFFKPSPKKVIIDVLKIPCGRCDGCHFDRCKQWSIRCEAESKSYADNCFVTLTYDDAHLPKGGTLVFKHLQDFFRSVRRAGYKFRYFACGEYGERLSRPHYHVCFFGFSFPDRILWSVRRGRSVFKSALLESKWKFGLSEIMDFTPGAAAYVAGYCFKKVGGFLKFFYYTDVIPEFVTMSRMPGLGSDFFKKYASDLYPHDKFVSADGSISKVPRFFDNLFEQEHPVLWSRIRDKRIADPVTGELRPEFTQDELDVRAELFRRKFKRQRRHLEEL